MRNERGTVMTQALGVLMTIVLAYLVTWWLAMNWRTVCYFAGGSVFVILAAAAGYQLSKDIEAIRGRRRH